MKYICSIKTVHRSRWKFRYLLLLIKFIYVSVFMWRLIYFEGMLSFLVYKAYGMMALIHVLYGALRQPPFVSPF